MKSKLFFAVAIILAATTAANAVTYTYGVDAVTTSGGSITGSFTMDPSNPTSISNIDISASFPGSISVPLAGGGGPSGVYLPTTINVNFDQLVGASSSSQPPVTFFFTNPDNSGNPYFVELLLFVTPSILSLDGTLWLAYSIGQSRSANNSEITYDIGSVYGYSTVTGQITISETPLPAALPLFATGLGALIGLLGWRRQRKAQAV
jgi:hypothetical protein